MKRTVLGISILVAMSSFAATANYATDTYETTGVDKSSFYVGARAGASILTNSCSLESCDNKNVGVGAIFGYDFGNWFGIEGTYDYLGNVAVNSSTFLPTTGDLTAFTVAPRFNYGLTDRTAAFGKVGLSWWNYDAGNFGSVSDMGWLVGIGVDHRVNNLVNLRLEYQYMPDLDKEEMSGTTAYKMQGDSHLLAAGITFHFGRNFDGQVVEPEITETIEPAPVVNEVLIPEIYGSVQFDFNRSELSGSTIDMLQPVLQRLQDVPEATAVISGYTDNVGPDAINQPLSLKRAQTVANYFITNGISTSRLIVQGLSSSNPVASNETREGRMRNRRVEVFSPELVVIEQ
ncbi:MAG: OmpA family protein [Enterovibrio sp.]